MSEVILSQFVSKKAYEICYAVLRVGAGVKTKSFSVHVEDRGLRLLTSVLDGDYQSARINIEVLENLLRIGSDSGIVNPATIQMMLQESAVLNSAIAELENNNKGAKIDVSEMFSSVPVKINGGKEAYGNSPNSQAKNNNESGGNMQEIQENSENINISVNPAKQAIRQSAIIYRIRQLGNCHLKDIQEYIPNASERTIRYDLQGLVEDGVVERVGSGGPATYYRIKDLGH